MFIHMFVVYWIINIPRLNQITRDRLEILPLTNYICVPLIFYADLHKFGTYKY